MGINISQDSRKRVKKKKSNKDGAMNKQSNNLFVCAAPHHGSHFLFSNKDQKNIQFA